MTRMRLAWGCLAAVLLAAPHAASAQNSIYGVRGIGFPGRLAGARARALGGGQLVFDRVSAINPAAAAGFPRLTAMAVSGSEMRGYDVGGSAVDGLQATRFPLAMVGGRFGGRVGFAFSFGGYAERSFDVTNTDTLLLRGVPVQVDDRLRSDGGIVDLRGAIGWAPVARFWVGAAGHLLSGSAKLDVRRTFADSTYRSFVQQSEASFSGAGVSGGFIWTVVPGLRLGGAVRVDRDLDTVVDSVPGGSVDLPLAVSGGIEVAPLPALRWSATATWRSWSDAAGSVTTVGGTAFDTWEVGTGIEIGGAATGESRIPLRLGFRYAQLPFSPTAERPREIDLSVGTGVAFANNRGLLDLAVERALRDGAGVRERAWLITIGMTVRP